jgi:hypothetical protein
MIVEQNFIENCIKTNIGVFYELVLLFEESEAKTLTCLIEHVTVVDANHVGLCWCCEPEQVTECQERYL